MKSTLYCAEIRILLGKIHHLSFSVIHLALYATAMILTYIFIDDFSGPGKVIGLVSLSLCAWRIACKLLYG